MARFIHHLSLIILLAMPSHSAVAQVPEDLQVQRQTLDQLQQSGKFLEALPLAERLSEKVGQAFGKNSGEYAAMLARRAGLLQALGWYKEAEEFYISAGGIAASALGPEHASVTFILNDQALLYKQQGRFAEAEPLYLKALSIREKTLGPDHVAVAHIVSNLAALYVAQGRYTEAEPLLVRSLKITEKALNPDNPEIGKNLNNLATLYWSLGRFNEAEPLYKRALTIVESALGSSHPAVSAALNNLAALYQDQGRYADAEPLFLRALSIREKALGPMHRDVGESADALAWYYHQAQHRYADAEPLYRRALDISEKALGPAHASVGAILNNLAVLYDDQGRYAEAEPLFKRAIAIRQAALGAKHSDVGQSMYRLANLYNSEKKFAEALPLHKRALEIRQAAQGPEHPDVTQSLDGIAEMYEAQGNWTRAIDSARKARDIVTSRARKGVLTSGSAALESGRRQISQGQDVFHRLIRTLWGLAEYQPSRRAAAANESYLSAQWADQTEASSALAQMSVRQAKGTGQLANYVRERQDLAQQWQALDKQLYASVALSAENRNADGEHSLHDQLAAIDVSRASIDKTLQREFPEYFALSNPEPVSVPATQKLLQPDEALVQFVIADNAVFLWAITKRDVRWIRSKMDQRTLVEHVNALRCGLDRTAWSSGECLKLLQTAPQVEIVNGERQEFLPFDLVRAFKLYQALLGPVDDLIEGKHLLVVPAGPLARLPFHVLVTERPKSAFLSKLADYRDVEWLGTNRPITVLPSAASVKALRQYAKASKATKSFLGIGNPLLEGPQDDSRWGAYYKRLAQAARDNQHCAPRPALQNIASTSPARTTNGFSELFRGGRANIQSLRRLPPLPETADELCEVANKLGVPEEYVLLGDRATEAGLKELSESGKLADYAIVHFATHGALTGQVTGTAEPGLILTPPPDGTDDPKKLERDDGYLAASEIANLKLDANWVILSACNTAGAGGETSEALSGLARAFFYSGTRALLVSHWEVGSAAAVKLTTRAFAELKSKPSIGRAEALRVSMRELVTMGSLAEAHPSQWAPFVVVGEGGR